MRDIVLAKLKQVEAENGVRVLYACEAGSRAWGFASQDSDYDVRFLYIRPVEWYLTIDKSPTDVIEYPLDANFLDVSGWDIRKALGLFTKSNPPMLEWLYSPTVYLDRGICASELRRLTAEYYSPSAAAHHYISMASGNYRSYLRDDKVWLKKYLYVIRPLLAARFLEKYRSIVPVAFSTLLDSVTLDEEVRQAVDELLATKMAGGELDMGNAVPALNRFIEEELRRLDHEFATTLPQGIAEGNKPLNILFQNLLKETI